MLAAGAQSGITTIGELAAAVRGRPGQIRFASASTGTGTHLAVAKLNRDLGIAAVHMPPAATDAITDVIVGTLARDIANTLATAELSEWLARHDADPMLMTPAEFGAFVASEAQRAAVLLSTS